MNGFSILLSEEMLQEALDAIREQQQPGRHLHLKCCVHLVQDGIGMIVTELHSEIIDVEPAQQVAVLDASEAVKIAEEIMRGGNE